MGWYGTGVMDGDEPVDCLGEIGDLIGYNYYTSSDKEEDKMLYPLEALSDDERAEVCKLLNNNMMQLESNDPEKTNIYWQVLGFAVMMTGAKMSMSLRMKTIEATRKDEWSRGEGGVGARSSEMAKLKTFLKVYRNGIPIAFNPEKFSEKFSEKFLGRENPHCYAILILRGQVVRVQEELALTMLHGGEVYEHLKCRILDLKNAIKELGGKV